ncbi:MAG: TIM barrel protein, partial [Polynucleobacter victoriensis]
MLYTDLPFLDRFAAAKADGFEAIECQFPYEWYAQTSLENIQKTMAQFNLPMVLHNLPAGDWANGERGIACDPKRVDEFRLGVPLAIKYAKALNVPRVNCIVGILPEGLSPELAQATLVSNLTYAAEELKKE